MYNIIMNDEEGQFPFEEFVEWLQERGDLRKKLKTVTTAICENNVYWVYSAIATIVEIIGSREEQPRTKCRSLEAAALLLETCEYSVLTFLEVYLLPILNELASFARKPEQQLSCYFKQNFGVEATAQSSQLSVQYVERGVQLIFHAARIKPYRTVETQELRQESQFSRVARLLTEKGVQEPKNYRYCDAGKQHEHRRRFLQKLKRFGSNADEWTEFLLVNLLQEVKANMKELLELRLLIPYGQSFLTSSVINLCEQELLEINQNLDEKRKYLALLNELVRNGDIQAIILVKNSEFVPEITAHISKLPGHTGINAGENIFPEIKATKQLKRQFYVDFLRSLQTWAICLPAQYDSEDFNIKSIWEYLKSEKKFKFPENLNLVRFEKEIKQNLKKNKERNDRLLEILENMQSSKQASLDRPRLSKMSNALQKATLLAPSQLQARLQQVRKDLKNLISCQESSSKAFKTLVLFKDSWISYLQSLDFEADDEALIETLITNGQRYVQQIQMVVPLQANFAKNKLTFKEFKERVAQTLEFHNDVSQNNIHQKAKEQLKSISLKASKMNMSNMAHSKLGKSKIGKSILEKIKQKSKIGDRTKLEMSKLMNRSNMLEKSKYLDKSKSVLDASKNIDASKRKVDVTQGKVEVSQRKVDVSQKKVGVSQRKLEAQEKVTGVAEKVIGAGEKVIGIGGQKISVGKSPAKQSGQKEDQERNKKSFGQNSQYSQTNKYQINESPALKHRKIDTSNPKRQEPKQASKKLLSKQQEKLKNKEDSEDEKIVRVADYQVDAQINKKRLESVRPSVSQDKSQGSRILMRRNRGSRLDRSQDSRQSKEKRSVRSNRKIKESSLYKRNQQDKTIKISEILEDMHNNKILCNQTIEVNGNVLHQIIHTEKKSKMKDAKPFDKFHQEAGEISSIQSSSKIKVFHHSAQKILNITAQISEMRLEQKADRQRENQRQRETQFIQNFPIQAIMPPLVANVCYSSNLRQKISETADNKNKFQRKIQKQNQLSPAENEDVPNFKQTFGAKTQTNEKIELIKTETKIKIEVHNEVKRSQKQRQFRKTAKQMKTQKLIRIEDSGDRLSAKQTQYYKQNCASQKVINSKQQQAQSKQIEPLRQKVLQLQKQLAFMRAKLAAKDNEIRSIKSASKDGSSRGFAHFTSPSNSNQEKSTLRSSSFSKRGEQTPFQREVQSGFKQYLQKIKGNTFRKSLLKSKCLVHKTEEIQIGCLSQRGDKLLESTLYVTPHRYDILEFTASVIHDSSIKVKISPEYIKCVSAHKQQKIYLTTEILKLPFCLPEVEINYKADSQYSTNYHRLTLPLGFNKYCLIQPFDPEISPSKNLQYVKTDNFKPDGKVLKLQKLGDSLPSFYHLLPTKTREQHLFVATCRYSESAFNLFVNIHEKYAWIEGFLIEGEAKAMNFLICTLKEVMQGSKK